MGKVKSTEPKPKKPFYKKWWFWVIIVIVVIGIIGSAGGSNDTETADTDTTPPTTEQTEDTGSTAQSVETAQDTEEETETKEQGEEETEEVPHRENMYGISDKDIDDLDSNFTVSNVRNDVTGNWRISTIAETFDIEDYALSYYKKYFSNDDEVHAIVNFNNKTTTRINVVKGVGLDVTILEYVDGEEHDAKELFGGMPLKEYIIYADNGDIEEVAVE